MSETRKAHERRLAEGFYEKYITGKKGIDIGCGKEGGYQFYPISQENCFHHDKSDCDAHDMAIFEDEIFDYVYSSHCLEHLENPVLAIKNWFRILKKGGYLIIAVPDRDSYERKKELPSRYNADHKFFITAYNNEPPNTFGLYWLIKEALGEGDNYEIEELETINTCTNMDKPLEHGDGSYEIETIIRKL